MPGTLTTKHGLPTMDGSVDLGESIDDTFNDAIDALDSIIATYASGTAAGRPAAATSGRFYNPVDARRVSLDTGSGWEEIPSAPLADLGADEGLWWDGTQWVSDKVSTARLADSAVTKAKLAPDALAAFVRHVSATGLQFNVGTAQHSFGALNQEQDTTFAHGLGTTPIAVIPWKKASTAHGDQSSVDLGWRGADATNATVRGRLIQTDYAFNINVDFYWLAIG